MTEEQKKKCEKIYNLYKLDSRNSGLFTNIKESVKFILMPIIPSSYLVKYGGRWIKITMLLAKVFNKNITKEEAEKIIDIFYKNQINPLYRNRIIMNQSNYIYIFWKIANYFDSNNKENNNK